MACGNHIGGVTFPSPRVSLEATEPTQMRAQEGGAESLHYVAGKIKDGSSALAQTAWQASAVAGSRR